MALQLNRSQPMGFRKVLLTSFAVLALLVQPVSSVFMASQTASALDVPAGVESISSPAEGSTVAKGTTIILSAQDTDAKAGGVQWALRYNTCVAGVGTKAGNVDGFHTSSTWVNGVFTASIDTTALQLGKYCFVFNPTQGERLTRDFTVVLGTPSIETPVNNQYFATSPILNKWSDVYGATKYRVEYIYGDGHQFTGGPYREVVGATQRQHQPGTGEQGKVTIRVQAIDAAGNLSEWSAPVSYTYDATPPSAPTNLRWVTSTNDIITDGGATSVAPGTAQWDASSDNEGVSHYVYKYWNDIEDNPYKPGHEYAPVTYGLGRNETFNQGSGVQHFCVLAVDYAGNESACTVFTLTYIEAAAGGDNNGGDNGGDNGGGDDTSTVTPPQDEPEVAAPNDDSDGVLTNDEADLANQQIFRAPLVAVNDREVLGTHNDNANTDILASAIDDGKDVKGVSDEKKSALQNLMGMAWYWWLLLAVIAAGLWLIIAARLRKAKEDQ